MTAAKATTISAALWAAFVTAILAICLAGCATCGQPNQEPADCRGVCARGAGMGCEWAKPLADGATCVQVCESANTILPWNTACVNASTTCEQAAVCR